MTDDPLSWKLSSWFLTHAKNSLQYGPVCCSLENWLMMRLVKNNKVTYWHNFFFLVNNSLHEELQYPSFLHLLTHISALLLSPV